KLNTRSACGRLRGAGGRHEGDCAGAAVLLRPVSCKSRPALRERSVTWTTAPVTRKPHLPEYQLGLLEFRRDRADHALGHLVLERAVETVGPEMPPVGCNLHQLRRIAGGSLWPPNSHGSTKLTRFQ